MRMLGQRGVDLIKTQSLIPRNAYFALADEATRLGILFEGRRELAFTGNRGIDGTELR